MENAIAQNSSVMGTVGANKERLFCPKSPNERMLQENNTKVSKDTQTILMPPFSNSKIPRSISEFKMNVHKEIENGSLVNASIYESFSVDESKYESFDDSLNEAHVSPKKINVSNFLSEQVNVTVRKVHDRQKNKGSYLCDSLEDICSLVSNVEHFSTSDEIENLNNILEKHGICEDSLRNDICHDKINASLNEQYFDEDSLAILEVEKPFDDSLEDVELASCVDSLMVLGNSIGDPDVTVDKLVAENCGATRNLFETSVQIIYENAPISSDESFQTAENFNSNRNSLSLSDRPMSRDSLEEIHDISEIASEKSLSMLPKAACDGNEVLAIEKTVLKSFEENFLPEAERTSELSPTSQIRFSNAESERTSSVVNSCYFYDSFSMYDLACGKNSVDKEASDKVIDRDSNYLDRSNFKPINKVKEKHTELKDCLAISSLPEIRNLITDSSVECCTSTDIANKICLKIEKETPQSTVVTPVLPSCDTVNVNKLKFQLNENIDFKIEGSEQPNLSSQTVGITPIFISASKDKCNKYVTKNTDESKNAKDMNVQSPQEEKKNDKFKEKVQVMKIDFTSSDHSPQLTNESIKKNSEFASDLNSFPQQRLVKNISTCLSISSPLNELDRCNITATKHSHGNELVENASNDAPDQVNLKLQVDLAIHKNCDVKPSSSQIKQLKYMVKHEVDTLGKIVTEAHKKIPSLAKIPEDMNSEDKSGMLIFTSKIVTNDKIKLGIQDAQLLQALDLYDHSYKFSGRVHTQSRDSIEPLNLCIRDKFPDKDNVLLESKENIPYVQNCKSQADSKGIVFQTKNKQNTNVNPDLRKPVGKACLTTKIPIRKADSPLSIPVNLKQDLKTSSCGGKSKKAPIVKSFSVDSIGKTSLEEMSKKHHFCMIRNSICRVPKSLQRPNAKKFQNVESPVAKYIGNAKIHSPLKTTYRCDGNLISMLPSPSTPKAASNLCVIASEIPSAKKVGKRLKS